MWASGVKSAGAVVPTSSLWVQRTGDVDYDKAIGDWTRDGAWHDWDLSSILPVGAKKVQIFVRAVTSGADILISFQKKGETGAVSSQQRYIDTNHTDCYFGYMVDVDANREIQYRVSAGAMTNLWAAIQGSFVEV